jgi:hypothetical protein
MHLIEDVERRFLPTLREAGAAIAKDYPYVKVDAGYSNPFGEATDSPGHAIGISCLLKNADSDQPDEVVLEIVISQLKSTPVIEADVIWGHPSGYIEMEILPKPVPIDVEVLGAIERDLSRLIRTLRAAIERGKPSLLNDRSNATSSQSSGPTSR